MTSAQKYFLIDEVYYHCITSIDSFEELFEITNNFATRQHKFAWNKLQNGLTHAAIVGSYIFSHSTKAKTRTTFLQAELALKSPNILNDAFARNYLAHIDEKFDYWIENANEFSGFVEAVFENRRAFEYLRRDNKFIRRVYLMEEMVFIYQLGKKKKEVLLKPIIDELNKVKSMCQNYADKFDKESNDDFFVIRP